jgi:hypothetical protein
MDFSVNLFLANIQKEMKLAKNNFCFFTADNNGSIDIPSSRLH